MNKKKLKLNLGNVRLHDPLSCELYKKLRESGFTIRKKLECAADVLLYLHDDHFDKLSDREKFHEDLQTFIKEWYIKEIK